MIKSHDGEFIYKEDFIPNPIRGKNKDGQVFLTAELRIIPPGITCYRLDLDGFYENEELMFKSMSGSEVIEHPITYQKHCSILSMPGVKSKKGGLAKVSLTRKSGEVISVSLPWGTEIFRYVKDDIVFDPED